MLFFHLRKGKLQQGGDYFINCSLEVMPLKVLLTQYIKYDYHKTLTKHGVSTIQGNLLILNVSFASSQCQYPRCQSHRSVLRDQARLRYHP